MSALVVAAIPCLIPDGETEKIANKTRMKFKMAPDLVLTANEEAMKQKLTKYQLRGPESK